MKISLLYYTLITRPFVFNINIYYLVCSFDAPVGSQELITQVTGFQV